MFDKWRKYSYAAQKSQRGRILWMLLCFLVLYIVYNIVSSFFFSVRVMENETMQPEIRPGDRLIFSSFAVSSLLLDLDVDGKSPPVKRGSVVLVDTGGQAPHGIFGGVLDGVVRFFTLQRISLFDREGQVFVKRIVGLPGDELTMTNFVFRVKPAADSYSLTEFERSDISYKVAIPQTPAVWDDSIPFSGSMDPIVLGKDQCFVVSDDRSNTNDSRTWGPVALDQITGRALFRYWPLNRIGRP